MANVVLKGMKARAAMVQWRRGVHAAVQQAIEGRSGSGSEGTAAAMAEEDSPWSGNPMRKTLNLLDEPGRRIGNPAYASLVRWCGEEKSIDYGRRVHAHIRAYGQDRNTFLSNLLIQMYGRCGCVEEARSVFHNIRHPDLYSWTLMIGAFAQNGHGSEALDLFRQMELRGSKPNKMTYMYLITACTCFGNLAEAKNISERVLASGIELDITLGNGLINMFAKCGSPRNARLVFDKTIDRNLATWTSMLAAYLRNGQGKQAIMFHRVMNSEHIKPDTTAFLDMLDTYANLKSIESTRATHEFVMATRYESNVAVRNALVSMYGKCCSPDDARLIFDETRERDMASWNSMIEVYMQNGKGKEALDLLQWMNGEGVNPDVNTFLPILNTCASLLSLEDGRELHMRIVSSGFESDASIRNALIDMYVKFGSMKDAWSVLDGMQERDTSSWNAIILACANNGQEKEALKLFQQMKLEGAKPDEVTFTNILKVCGNACLVDEGLGYFIAMALDHDITPSFEHYVCMIGLLGKTGCLDEAEDLVNSMPVQLTVAPWNSLLNACHVHGDVDRAVVVCKHLSDLEPDNVAPFFSMLNIYAAADRWSDVSKVRRIMDERGLKEQLERCSIEVKGTAHEVRAGDLTHPQLGDIYSELQRLILQLRQVGYAPEKEVSLHDGELQKEHMSCFHTTKLAITFGLTNTPFGAPLQIFKDQLQLCSDCHVATRFISRIVGREIAVRNGNCLHHFKDGICSCGDN